MKSTTLGVIDMGNGSRFGILSNNQGESLEKGMKEPNPVDKGKKISSEKDLAGNLLLNASRKKSGKDKSKGMVGFFGSKIKINALKPNNSFGSSSGVENPFDDGSQMGSKILEKVQRVVMFKVIGHGLDSEKHLAVRVSSENEFDWGNKFFDGVAIEFENSLPLDPPRLTDVMRSGENFG